MYRNQWSVQVRDQWAGGLAMQQQQNYQGDVKLCEPLTSAPSTVSQYAAIEALNGPQEDIAEMRKAFQARRYHSVTRMNEIEGVSCIKPQGAFYVMMNMESFLGKEMYDEHQPVVMTILHSFFLEKGLVATVPCSAFAAPGFIRWSYATLDAINR